MNALSGQVGRKTCPVGLRCLCTSAWAAMGPQGLDPSRSVVAMFGRKELEPMRFGFLRLSLTRNVATKDLYHCTRESSSQGTIHSWPGFFPPNFDWPVLWT